MMLAHPKITDLTTWPAVNSVYLVPHVYWPEKQFMDDPWFPIYGDKHTDFADDEIEHVHIDPRFISTEQERQLSSAWRHYRAFHHLLALRKSKHPDGIKGALGFAPPVPAHFVPQWKPRVCRRKRVTWDVAGAGDADYHASADDRVAALRFMEKVREGDSIKASAAQDGRPRCPHQQFDLTAVWDGTSQFVRCPLHGMKVDMSRCSAAKR